MRGGRSLWTRRRTAPVPSKNCWGPSYRPCRPCRRRRRPSIARRTSPMMPPHAPASAPRDSRCIARGALVINGFVAEGFRGTTGACGPCARRPRDPCDPDACADRYAGRARAVRAALRDGGAGVWERALQQGARPLHVARTDQGRWAVEAQLPGAQHRKARPGAGAHPRQGARHHALPRRVRQPPARQAAARLAPIEVDPLACPSCQSPMRIVACITQESDPTLRARRRGAHEPGDAAMTAPP